MVVGEDSMSDIEDQETDFKRETCSNGRFIRSQTKISESQYRTIYQAYDNETGCEVAWSIYNIHNLAKEEVELLSRVLQEARGLKHSFILRIIYS